MLDPQESDKSSPILAYLRISLLNILSDWRWIFCKYRTDELETFLEDLSRSDENENDCTGVTIKSTLAMDVYICSQEVVMIVTWITINTLIIQID